MKIIKIFVFSVALFLGIQNNFLKEAKANSYMPETESTDTNDCFNTSDIEFINYNPQRFSEAGSSLHFVYWPGHQWYHRHEIRPWIDPFWEPALEPHCVEICHPWGCHYKCD